MAIDASLFDHRGYVTASASGGYGEWAVTYEETVAVGLDGPLLARLTAIDWGSVAEAADLACGTGRTGEWLKEQGVGAVDGVDITPEMLALAERKGVYRSLTLGDVGAVDGVDITPEMLALAERKGVYRSLTLGDVGAAPLPAKRYELVTMSLADEHLPELTPARGLAPACAGRAVPSDRLSPVLSDERPRDALPPRRW